MVQMKFAAEVDDEERFVSGVDRACAMECLDVESAGLRARRSVRDLDVMSM
jgi:hypothetical protein